MDANLVGLIIVLILVLVTIILILGGNRRAKAGKEPLLQQPSDEKRVEIPKEPFVQPVQEKMMEMPKEPVMPPVAEELAEMPDEPVVPPVVEKQVEMPNEPVMQPVAEKLAEMPTQDDLVLVEGIGTKVAILLNQHGIKTFAQLASTSVPDLQTILLDNGLRFMKPDSWPEQARLAAAGKMEELKALQEKLVAGR